MLKAFEDEQDHFVLWWRPSKLMVPQLEKVSSMLDRQYQRILNNYKDSAWGICDETDNIDRAVKWCDVYYGDMNAIIQPFQNAGKPVILSTIGEERI